jgi:putative DNA primase/helicase
MEVGMNSADQFREAILATGLTPPDVIEAGRFHRFPGYSKRNGNTAGWCKLFPDERGGVFGDFSSGIDESWQAEPSRVLTAEERERHRKHIEEARAEAEAARQGEQKDAAAKAAEIWDAAEPAPADHPYLVCKKVAPYGLRLHKEALLVPLRDPGGELRSLQFIFPDGSKRYLSGGQVRGCYFGIGKPSGVLYIVEGYATGASVHAATRHAVAVAFDAGNLERVARDLHAKYPQVNIVLCADDDYLTTGNPGTTKAKAAALAVDGLVAVPHFGPGRPEGATDFNDMAEHHGLQAVRRALVAARVPDIPAITPATRSLTVGYSAAPEVTLIRADGVKMVPVTWRWAGHLAAGKLHAWLNCRSSDSI